MEGHFEVHPTSGLHDTQESSRKCVAESAQASSAAAATSGCFECNICLDFAMDPVVTLCGHLYCWPCIYKWLELETSDTPQRCPVCKASLSETTLVPLYGRGQNGSKDTYNDGSVATPSRPSIHHRGQTLAASLVEPELSQSNLDHRHHRRHHHRRPVSRYGYINGNTQSLYGGNTQSLYGVSQLLGSTAVAVLPWVFGDHISTGLQYSNRYYLVGNESNQGQRRQEIREMIFLHRIFAFLFCCMLLCLLLF